MADTNKLFTDIDTEDVILPDGYEEGDNFFDIDSWGSSSDEEGASAEEETTTEEDTESVEGSDGVTTTDEEESAEESEATEEEAPTTEQNHKLHFKAKIDHSDVDVDISEDELPALYQKANNHDRMQAKIDKMTSETKRYSVLAKALGYDSVSAMLDAAEKNYKDGEISRLTDEGVHQEVAQDIVDRKFRTAQAEVETSTPAPKEAARDFQAEAQALLDARPDLKGKPLPDEVFKACVKGKTMLEAYTEYEARVAKAENVKLQKENKIMRQNARASAKAPVSGTRGGGKTDTSPTDDFLRGFDADDW